LYQIAGRSQRIGLALQLCHRALLGLGSRYREVGFLKGCVIVILRVYRETYP
jgi:hypothetical protein